ncbi:unnamed protein product [Coccothraustes coccothraustes]
MRNAVHTRVKWRPPRLWRGRRSHSHALAHAHFDVAIATAEGRRPQLFPPVINWGFLLSPSKGSADGGKGSALGVAVLEQNRVGGAAFLASRREVPRQRRSQAQNGRRGVRA